MLHAMETRLSLSPVIKISNAQAEALVCLLYVIRLVLKCSLLECHLIARSHIIAKLVCCHAAKIASHLPQTLSRRNVATNSCPAFLSVATSFTTLDSTRP